VYRPFNKKILYKDSLLCVYRQEKTVSTSRTTNAVHTVQKFAEIHTVQLTWDGLFMVRLVETVSKDVSCCVDSL